MQHSNQHHIVIIESRTYPEIMDIMYQSAVSSLAQYRISASRVTVPQLYDIPSALRLVAEAVNNRGNQSHPDAFLTLGFHTSTDTREMQFCEIIRNISDLSSYFSIICSNGLFFEDSVDSLRLPNKSQKPVLTAQSAVQSCISLIQLRHKLSLGNNSQAA